MNPSSPRAPGARSFPFPPLRVLTALSGVGALMFTACARTQLADNHRQSAVRARTTVNGHPAMPEDNLPNPARAELKDTALERMQSGVPFSRL